MDCIFCKIANNEAGSYKIYEDKDYIAILDIFPNIRGQTLVIPKRHIDSYAFDLPDDELCRFMATSKKVAKIIEKGLKVARVHIVLEGTAINHLHAKLYPAIGMNDKNEQHVSDEVIHFDKYPGYVTTILGPKARDDELKNVMEEIIKNNKNGK
ncbi:MAG: HIT family protein [Candidatus Micrarchaeia archaeon]